MEFIRYKNENSGVTAYKIEKEAVYVVFDDVVYRYSYKIPGKKHVENMKKLALQGKGLSTYISRSIKESYEDKYNLKAKRDD